MPRLFGFLLASAALVVGNPCAVAQRATAVPQLNMDKLTGTWYQIAKLPTKSDRKCVSDGTMLYALGDKAKALQIGNFCTIQGGDKINSNSTAHVDKSGDGKLKIRRLFVFSRPYWILATDPAYTWALVGTPNHKSLWVLSRQATVAPELYNQLQATAAAQGFPVAKLEMVPHPKGRVTLASPSANPNQIETPSPTATKTQ